VSPAGETSCDPASLKSGAREATKRIRKNAAATNRSILIQAQMNSVRRL